MKRTLAPLIVCIANVFAAFAATDYIAPGDSLVSRYTESRRAWLGSWHPLRREMLIITRFAETYQVHLVKFPGGRTQLTFFKENVQGASYQPTRGDYLSLAKTSGEMKITRSIATISPRPILPFRAALSEASGELHRAVGRCAWL